MKKEPKNKNSKDDEKSDGKVPEIVCVHCNSTRLVKVVPTVILADSSRVLYECLDCGERQYS